MMGMLMFALMALAIAAPGLITLVWSGPVEAQKPDHATNGLDHRQLAVS
jgi:hypothetical protein